MAASARVEASTPEARRRMQRVRQKNTSAESDLRRELNRKRYEEEQASAPAAKLRAPKGRAKAVYASQRAFALVDASEAQSKISKTKAPAKKASKRSSR